MQIERQAGLRCLACEDEIFSEHVHDFRGCTCGNCFVDGGLDYFRYGWTDKKYIKIIYRNVKELEDGSIQKVNKCRKKKTTTKARR